MFSHFFQGWSKESVWIFVVDVLILILIFCREYVWDAWVWWRERGHTGIDRRIVDFLSARQILLAVDIGRQLQLDQKKVEESLVRLLEQQRVNKDGEGRWWKIPR
jgi:hypothetical protein